MAVAKTSRKKVADTEATKVLDAVQDLDITTVVKEMGDLQVQVQQSLAGLSASLTGKVQKLEEVDQAISLREQRLKELFQIESEAVSLDDLRQQKEQEVLDADRKRTERDNLWVEQEVERSKKWKREDEERAYATKVQRERALAEHQSLIDQHQRDEIVRQNEFNRVLADRENAMKARETELDELRKTVAGIDARVKADVTRAEAILTNVLKKQHEHEVQLLRKDTDTAQVIHTAEITSLKASIATLQDQVKDLNVQLLSARADAKEVAQEALKGASQRQVADALQGALSNANSAGKTK